MFLSEKMVPKINFASSCALNLAGRALPGPRSGAPLVLDAALAPEMGRLAEGELEERGRSERAQSREYMHSACWS